MNSNIAYLIREKSKQLLEYKEINIVLGYEKGINTDNATPIFIRNIEDIDKLIWDETCIQNLSKYLMEEKLKNEKVLIISKGYDSKGIVRLIQDNQIDRENIVILGIRYNDEIPVMYDFLIGEEIQDIKEIRNRYEKVDEIESLSIDERREYWERQFSRCIKCYACRNICSACNCKICCFESNDMNFSTKKVSLDENEIYHTTRAFHVAGRCTGCGECARVCPMNIPLMKLNDKVRKDMEELFEFKGGGISLDIENPLGTYKLNDPDSFL